MIKDEVKKPNHYLLKIRKEIEVEVLEIIRSVLTLEEYRGYLHGNILKYTLRAKKKHKTPEIDFLKAREYINYYLKTFENDNNEAIKAREQLMADFVGVSVNDN